MPTWAAVHVRPASPSPQARLRDPAASMRRPRALRSGWSLLLALGAVTTLVLLSLHARPMSSLQTRSPRDAPETTQAPKTPAQPPARPRPAPCLPNTSLAAHPDFAAQPTHVRDFLLYRHCRDFPTLQDAPAAKCASRVFLLLAIKSSPANYERRDVVRRTWGQERQVQGLALRRLFLVGTAAHPHEAAKVNRLLALEAREHGDILQWDFHDSFFNLTLKQVRRMRARGSFEEEVVRAGGLKDA